LHTGWIPLAWAIIIHNPLPTKLSQTLGDKMLARIYAATFHRGFSAYEKDMHPFLDKKNSTQQL